ncbi:helicase-related protein [Sphingomonas crocodyli]|uniref:Transcription-repair-coupling factor n=1 Tax=Sphingomonas crocodyli TaxID=1979270 RepID=A0A437LYC5_9SPHN|nr:helicase-related protein [Sphingomonas crocodyli]RVT90382.1 DEAD/DEAH box helicase [Sphingomonas crocodyli]
MQLAKPHPHEIVTPADLAEALGAPAAIGPTLARLVEAIGHEPLICIALDETRAIQLAAGLTALAPAAQVIHLKAPDALPGEVPPASPANIGSRDAALRRLAASDQGERVLIMSIDAALAQVPILRALPPLLTLRRGMTLDAETLGAALIALGYREDDRVDEPGEMARRAVIELFPTSLDEPVRLEMEGRCLTSLRRFDPISQRSRDDVEVVTIHPAQWAAPWKGVSALSYWPDARIALDPGVGARVTQLHDLAADAGSCTLVSAAAWQDLIGSRRRVDIAPGDEEPVERFVEARRPAQATLSAITRWQLAGDRIILAGDTRDLRFLTRRLTRTSPISAQAITSWAEVARLPSGAVATLAMPLEEGWSSPGLRVVAAADVLGSRAGSGHDDAGELDDPLHGGIDLRVGDLVLHEEHGLGRLSGLETIASDGLRCEAVRLEYAGGTHRLVPIEEADRLWRYGADTQAVSLDRLNGSSWAKRREAIIEAIATTARTLVAMATARRAREVAPLAPPVPLYERFAGRFPYALTRDQRRAVDAVRADLLKGRAMDRLIVGDVGYGKTEVALRAAAMVALAGRQVALVAPTTVLARQHAETIRRRFADLGIEIATLSRLTSPAEARAIRTGLADGSIRLVVGTQALASQSVSFADLGLVIIDEEQRFGAAQKARLREQAQDGHVLTLTATPIPRTLQTALIGLQDLSVIATPPARRQPIRTMNGEYDPDRLRAALLRERDRGGQSFVVVPRVEDIEPLSLELSRLVPGFVIRRAHGQMPSQEADAAMLAFAQGDGDVLLATNIIEAGLDVPRANLMAVMHADRFGLGQLHQLRGRVGRGARRGTILLFTEAGHALAPATAKRLKTLEALDHLGAGFAISAQDLDHRGAGDLIGDEQAGHVRLIGVDLYQHWLARALAADRGEAVERWSPDIRLACDANLPETWIPEEDLRLGLYIRLARLDDDAAVDAFAEELEDRFGALPPEAGRLIALARIRRLACATRVARIDAGPAAIALTPRPDFIATLAELEAKGDRLLLRGDPGPDPLAAVAALLERVRDAPAARPSRRPGRPAARPKAACVKARASSRRSS